jgi:hypothetical protein
MLLVPTQHFNFNTQSISRYLALSPFRAVPPERIVDPDRFCVCDINSLLRVKVLIIPNEEKAD